LIHGGADHLVLGLKSCESLAAMKDYDLNAGWTLMNNNSLVTILLAYAKMPQLFHTHNPFASGYVLEDPAMGAATAALGGYLWDIDWPHGGVIDVIQGEDMGMQSLLRATIGRPEAGTSICISGMAQIMKEDGEIG
jgi:predicted PhzF superfamily epimerase YddE/YHI9